VYWLRLADRYGAMGLVGIGILAQEGKDAVIHSFVLSCRAANRGIEQAMVAYLAGKARERGCERLVGELVPTPKNTPIREMYPKLGFTKIAEPSPAGDVTRFARPLAGDDLVVPDYLRLRGQ